MYPAVVVGQPYALRAARTTSELVIDSVCHRAVSDCKVSYLQLGWLASPGLAR